MKKSNYTAPVIETVEIDIENAILTASGEDSVIDFGE